MPALGDGSVSKCQVQPGWFRDYARLPVRRRFVFAPHVASGSDQKRVELIGTVDAPGGDGPSNGMYALPKELRKRIASGLDWLTIKSLPASRDAIPWFWNWADRRYAAWWDEQGLPFVQGANMLFVNSGTPRIDAEECTLLDAAHCRAMFCHTPWYADLIRRHRGPAKAYFDSLFSQRDVIEAEFGQPLEWERLDDKRASRVAVHREASIDCSSEELQEVHTWAVETLLKMKKVFGPRASGAT